MNTTNLMDSLAGVADTLRQSTVQVRAGRQGGGSGIIWEANGLIVTNAHVARGPDVQVEISDGRAFDAKVIARDPERDLAAVRVLDGNLPAAAVGNSDHLRVGDLVIAAGNPLGMVGAVTIGIVHAVSQDRGNGRRSWVQADVRLAPGNSGGPLADAAGRVIGVNSMVGGGLGLAVPSNEVERFLRHQGSRPRLGALLQPVLVPGKSGQVPGFMLIELDPTGSASAAGLQQGDIVIGASGQLFTNPGHLLDLLDRAGAGETLSLELVRAGHRQTLEVHLESEVAREAA